MVLRSVLAVISTGDHQSERYLGVAVPDLANRLGNRNSSAGGDEIPRPVGGIEFIVVTVFERVSQSGQGSVGKLTSKPARAASKCVTGRGDPGPSWRRGPTWSC